MVLGLLIWLQFVSCGLVCWVSRFSFTLGAWLLVVACCFMVVGVLIMLLVFVSFAVAWAAVFVYGLLAYLIWLGSMWYLVL